VKSVAAEPQRRAGGRRRVCGGTYLSAIRIEDMKSLLGAYDDTALEVMRWLEWMVARVMEFIPASTLSTLARAVGVTLLTSRQSDTQSSALESLRERRACVSGRHLTLAVCVCLSAQVPTVRLVLFAARHTMPKMVCPSISPLARRSLCGYAVQSSCLS
jgi:hypothetical protein